MDVSTRSVVDWQGAIPEENTVPPRPMTWREIADDLEQRIRSGEYPPGSYIPSYRKIGDLYGVSPATAGKAVARLTDRGLIEEHVGRGNAVRDPDTGA